MFNEKTLNTLKEKRVSQKNTGLGIRKHKIRCCFGPYLAACSCVLLDKILNILINRSFINSFTHSPIHLLLSNKHFLNVSCVLGTALDTEDVKINIPDTSLKEFIDQPGR